MSPDRAARNAHILAAHAAGATLPQIAASLELDPSLGVCAIGRNERGV